KPVSSAMRARTNSDVHSFSRNFRAVARSISWSALNPKSIRLLLALGQSEHPLADDVLLDLGRAALDGVGARPEEGILPYPVVDGDVGAAPEHRVRPLNLHGQLLQPLVRVHPAHLAGRGFGAGQLAAQQLGDGPRAGVLQRLGVDPQRRQLVPP